MTVLMGDTRNIALAWHKTPNFITNCRGNITGPAKDVKSLDFGLKSPGEGGDFIGQRVVLLHETGVTIETRL